MAKASPAAPTLWPHGLKAPVPSAGDGRTAVGLHNTCKKALKTWRLEPSPRTATQAIARSGDRSLENPETNRERSHYVASWISKRLRVFELIAVSPLHISDTGARGNFEHVKI